MSELSNHAIELEDAIAAYSGKSYAAQRFAHAACSCHNETFRVYFDEREGCAVRVCSRCGLDVFIADSQDYLEDAEFLRAECTCGSDAFQLSVGVALYRNSEDVRWLYLGLRCTECGLAGVYADWKNEYPNVEELLERV